MPIERTYDEWKDSWYAGQGIECQDCHMTPGPGVTKNPGKATPFSKDRQQIYTHYFVGGNTMVTKMLGAESHSKQAEEMLRASAKIEILDGEQLVKGAMQKVSVQVTNIGAGHKLPTGFPEGREMWIDFKVTDADGKQVYRLGAIKKGHTEPATKSFKVVLGDKNNKIVDLELWTADRVLYDTRIPAKGRSIVDYVFDVPEHATGPLTITADLNYWSFPQSIVDLLLGDKTQTVPITQMTSVIKTVPLVSDKLVQR